jgi:hypothetical protein
MTMITNSSSVPPPCQHLQNNDLPCSTFQAEEIPVAGAVDPAIDNHRQSDRLGLVGVIVGLLVEDFREGVAEDGEGIGQEGSGGGSDLVEAGFTLGQGREFQGGGGEGIL